MFQIKSILIFALICCYLCLGVQIENSLGERVNHDVQLYGNYEEQSPLLGSSRTVFPHPNNDNSDFYITYIQHSVALLDRNNYTLDIKSGGIGHKEVVIKITKHDTEEFDYNEFNFTGWLEIYGGHESCYQKK